MKLYGFKLVIAVTGGGSLFISDRLTEGGASEYLLEAHVPYAQSSLEKFVGGKVREKFCSGSTARQMALASYQRGLDLGEKRTIGVGVTCSLAKPGGEREGRVHSIYIALVHKEHCVVVKWTNHGKGSAFHDRMDQERAAALFTKKALEIFVNGVERMGHKESIIFKDMFDGLNMPELGVEVTVASTFGSDVFRSANGPCPHISYHGIRAYDHYQSAAVGYKPICIYSGSFNPWHEGHQDIYDYCVKEFGKENTFLELSVMNFDKPGIDPIEIDNRAAGLKVSTLFTNTSTFIKKYMLLKQRAPIVFAVGADTFDRINLDDFDNILVGNVKFLVFPRNGKSIRDYGFLPEHLIDGRSWGLTKENNVSSTDLRTKTLV